MNRADESIEGVRNGRTKRKTEQKKGKEWGKESPSFFSDLFLLHFAFCGGRSFLLCEEVYAHQSQSGFKQLFFRIRRQCGAVFKP